MEEAVFSMGNWSSIYELEDSITMQELHRLFISQQEKSYNEKVFAAALKGVKMDPWVDPDEADESGRVETPEQRFQRIKREAEIEVAIANGDLPEGYTQSEASSVLEGFAIESEDD